MNGINGMNRNLVGAEMLAYMRGEKDLYRERARIAELKKQAAKTGLAYWLNNPQKRRVQRLWEIVSLLEEDGRMAMSEIARRLNLPVSTVFDMMKEVERHFRFTIVLKDQENGLLAENTPSQIEFAYKFLQEVEKEPEVLLSPYTKQRGGVD
jgi:hypothetical protein